MTSPQRNVHPNPLPGTRIRLHTVAELKRDIQEFLSPGSAMEPAEPTIVVPSSAPHSATVIFVHGSGDTGRGWQSITDVFSADETLKHIKWILPTAPMRRVTVTGGMPMPSWFDIYDRELAEPQDEEGMSFSARTLNAFVTAEVDAGLPAHRIVLAGFSQGGTMSILAGLGSVHRLGGILVLSGRVPIPSKFESLVKEQNKTVPIFWGHGKEDYTVKYIQGLRSAEFLRTAVGVPQGAHDAPQNGGLIFRAYDGLQHSTSPQELRDIKEWLRKVIPSTT